MARSDVLLDNPGLNHVTRRAIESGMVKQKALTELDEARALIAGWHKPAKRLEWLLEVLNKSINQIDDWRKLRVALAAFCATDGRDQSISGAEREIDKPTEEEARNIITGPLNFAVRQAVERKDFDLGITKSEPHLWWSGHDEGYHEIETTDDWKSRVMQPLKNLLLTHAKMLKHCEARKSRSEEKCSRWFVAQRRDQIYCSPICASRESTRLSRAQKTKPIKKKKRKRRSGISP